MRLFPVLLLLLAALPLEARHLALSPEGDDRGPGTEEKPWKTLAHASRKLRSGDQLMLRDGTYPGTLSLADFSPVAPPVRIFAQHPGKAVIRPAAGKPAVRFRQMWKCELSGVVLDGGSGGRWFDLSWSGSLLFRNLTLLDHGPDPSCFEHINTVIWHNCAVDGSGGGNAPLWEFRITGLMQFHQCAFRRTERPLMVFTGACVDNRFELCTFSGEGPVPQLRAEDGRITFARCRWMEKTLPDASLFAAPRVLFRRNVLENGGYPERAFAACSLNNTVIQKKNPGPYSARQVNDLVTPYSKKIFRGGTAFPYRLWSRTRIADTGKPVTVVTRASGGQAKITVSESRFFDGKGMSLLQPGEMIWLGRTHFPVRVVQVNHARRTLELDRAADVPAETPVYEPFHGQAPDPGACELGLELFGIQLPGVSRRPLPPEHFRERPQMFPEFFGVPPPMRRAVPAE